MLTPAVVRSASGAASYYAADNYYTDGQATEASLWVGEGAAELGLTGEVGREPFEAVLRGELPNGATIPPGANGKHRARMDFTFSAPKSMSLLAYVGGDARLLAAHMASVRSTVGWIERNLAETRVAKDGERPLLLRRPEDPAKVAASAALDDFFDIAVEVPARLKTPALPESAITSTLVAEDNLVAPDPQPKTPETRP